MHNVSGLCAGGELGAITEQFTKILLALTIFPWAQFHRLRIGRVMYGLSFSQVESIDPISLVFPIIQFKINLNLFFFFVH